MQISIYNVIDNLKLVFAKAKSKLTAYTNDKRIVNYVLYANCIFVVIFFTMIFVLNQKKISNYLDIREAIGRLKEVSEGYELELIRAQVTLEPDIKKINLIINGAEKERRNIAEVSRYIDNEDYIKNIDKYIEILDKRLITRHELIAQYVKLAKLYKDYLIIANNSEKAINDNLDLQLEVKHIMLNLEGVRLIAINKNRDNILQDIYSLQNKLIYFEPVIQEKVGLFVTIAEDVIKSLRYLDTIRSSMQSDGHDVQLEHLKLLTAEQIYYEEIKFSSKLLFCLILSVFLVTCQFFILTFFFVNKKRTERLQKDAHDTINKSKEIAERAKLYALDAQRAQYKLLYNFCGDFDAIISTVSYLTCELKSDTDGLDEISYDISLLDKQKISIATLNSSIVTLERWLNNYLEVYTPQNSWADVKDDQINLTDLFDRHFAEARFFLRDRQHLLSIFHGETIPEILADKEYLLKLFINMIYVSVKWSTGSWLKLSITIRENPDEQEEEKKFILNISIVNGASNEKYLEGLDLFHKDNSLLQSQNNDIDSNDRFIVAALYYMRQICDILRANIQFERNYSEENILTVEIPVKLLSSDNPQISVPILNNKNILVISPYSSILKNIEQQLTAFGLNVTALNDKYSAIGHIVGVNQAEQKYDLFIIDHNPPDIDAEALTKIIRENSRKNLAHVIVITTEQYLSEIEKNKSIYDASFVKPVMPQLLKSKLEELVEIQLYGVQGKEDDTQEAPAEDNTIRFLAVMHEDLSTMLLQFILTKSNFHIDVVSSSAQIFDLIENNYYNFILVSNKCDFIMPENLGRDIRRHHSKNKDSVLVMIYDSLKDTQHKKLIRSGYDDFIPLPLSRGAFIEKIEEWSDPIAQRMSMSAMAINTEAPPEDTSPEQKEQDNN